VYWNRENAADEKLKKELENDKEFTEILEEINKAEPHQNTQTWVDSNLKEVDTPVTDEAVTINIPPKSRIQELMEQAEQELKNKTK
jgi:gluconate kinase